MLCDWVGFGALVPEVQAAIIGAGATAVAAVIGVAAVGIVKPNAPPVTDPVSVKS